MCFDIEKSVRAESNGRNKSQLLFEYDDIIITDIE